MIGRRAKPALAVAGLLWPALVAASSPTDPHALEVANRMGLLEHCQAEGFVEPGAIGNARKVLGDHPVMPPASALERAENDGRQGVVLVAGTLIPLRNLADRTHRTIQQLCGGFAASAKAGAAMLDGS